jgi:hypothetical protein
MSYKIRFNLRRGVNYLKWEIISSDGIISYYSPTEVQLVLKECELKNKKNQPKEYTGG